MSHYSVHKSPTLDPVLSQMNPVHVLMSYFSKTLILSSDKWQYLLIGPDSSYLLTRNMHPFCVLSLVSICPYLILLLENYNISLWKVKIEFLIIIFWVLLYVILSVESRHCTQTSTIHALPLGRKRKFHISTKWKMKCRTGKIFSMHLNRRHWNYF